MLTAKATSGSTVYWYGAATGYSVTYTPPAGAALADPVTAATVATTANAGDT